MDDKINRLSNGGIMAHVMTIDLKNLAANASNYKVVSFPKRVRITEMSFSVNGAAAGSPELARVWRLYTMGAHPTPQPEYPWSEWTFSIFNWESKPLLENANANFYSTISTPLREAVLPPNGDGFIKVEMDGGVFAAGDYMAVWVQNDGGNIDDIVWENTEATINIVYEETTKKSVYEQVQANPWLD